MDENTDLIVTAKPTKLKEIPSSDDPSDEHELTIEKFGDHKPLAARLIPDGGQETTRARASTDAAPGQDQEATILATRVLHDMPQEADAGEDFADLAEVADWGEESDVASEDDRASSDAAPGRLDAAGNQKDDGVACPAVVAIGEVK